MTIEIIVMNKNNLFHKINLRLRTMQSYNIYNKNNGIRNVKRCIFRCPRNTYKIEVVLLPVTMLNKSEHPSSCTKVLNKMHLTSSYPLFERKSLLIIMKYQRCKEYSGQPY